MLSTVILNWKRPQNVRHIIDGLRCLPGLVDDITIWNNNASKPFDYDHDCNVINTNCDMGLYTRFAAAAMAKHDAVLIQDDDIELPHETITALYEAWAENPQILHGIFGRKPKRDGSYAKDVLGNEQCPVVLTRCLIMHRKYASAFFVELPRFADLQQGTQPFGNGEDIILSYVACKYSGLYNRVHRLKRIELPAPAAIHGRYGGRHFKHRTELMRRCEEWLPL